MPAFKPPAEHVSALLELLESRRDALLEVAENGWEACIVLSYASDNGQGGMTFTPKLLGPLVELHVGISIDVLLTGDDEE